MDHISYRKDGTQRVQTNSLWLYLTLGFLSVMFISVAYSGFKGDTARLTHGFDDCGYICGFKNERNTVQNACFDPDKSSDPKLLVDFDLRNRFQCVESCDSEKYIEVMNRCWKLQISSSEKDDLKSSFASLERDLVLTSPTMIISIGISIIFSYMLLLLFRYVVEYVIWIIHLIVILLLAGISLTYLVFYMSADSNKYGGEQGDTYILMSIIFGVLSGIFLIILLCCRNRIKLISQLFTESSKALMDVPAIMFEPILTLVALVISAVPFIYFQIIIETSGDINIERELGGYDVATLYQNNFIKAARFINIIAYIWFTQFVLGCQHFVIAGTISKWYFTRDKKKLSAPMMTTFKDLIFFHLGSICVGSWILTIIKILRMIVLSIKASARNFILKIIADWLLRTVDRIFQYLIRNAYIIVAKDGIPFFESGRKSRDLIVRNLIDILSLNHFGNLVLFMGRVFVVLITGFVAYEMMNGQSGVNAIVLPMTIVILFSILIVHCFITVFEMTVDTIMLCYCEDCDENDGSSDRPYFMSEELKQVMNNLKEGVGNKQRFQTLNDRNVGSQPIGLQSVTANNA